MVTEDKKIYNNNNNNKKLVIKEDMKRKWKVDNLVDASWRVRIYIELFKGFGIRSPSCLPIHTRKRTRDPSNKLR